MNIAMLILRLVVGLLFIGHGTQKLFGWFGGHGIAGTAGFFDSLGLRPSRHHAIAAGVLEAGGGLLLVLGLLTPFAAAAITAVMVTAIATVHGAKGLWNTGGGYEFNLVLLAVVFAIAGAGPGAWSLDHAFALHLSGTVWALVQLAAGIIGGVGAVVAGQRARRPADQQRRARSSERGGRITTA